MSYREICRILSSFLYLYAGILTIPLLMAAYYQFALHEVSHPQPHSTAAFGYTVVICLVLAKLLRQGLYKKATVIYRKEALAAVVLIWFLSPAIACLPFLFSGTLERFDQAYFEAASGFSTTGATVLDGKKYDPQTGKEVLIKRTYCGMNETAYTFYGTIKPVKDPLTANVLEGIEAVGSALLFWRSLMQWLGGMGIIALFVAFLPELGVRGKFLFQTEAPGPIKEGFKPRITETALQLWEIYLGLTLAQIVLLMLVNEKMPLFDAITLAFSTVSTGGFSVHNENVAYYHQAATDWVILLFMILGSINFSLYYYWLKGKFYRLFEPELIGFLASLVVLGAFVVWNLKGTSLWTLGEEFLGHYSFSEALRIGFFQLVSAQTSTGFFLAHYDTWPFTIQLVLLIAMYLGGMSGSSAGGIKIIRFQILFQIAKNKIESIFRPKTARIMHIGHKEIDTASALSILCFFFIAMVVSTLATFLYVCDGIDPETALGLTACMVNNTGLAFRAGGPTSTMAFLSPFSSYLSSFIMILGRLEYYAVLVVLIPAFWKE